MDKFMYMLFIASIMIGNGIYFGPCTIRQYCAIYFFIYIFVNQRKIRGYSKLLFPYLIFIFMYGLSSINENNIPNYLRQLVALYAVAIVGYYATILIMKKYNIFKYLAVPFVVIGIINGIINILQYKGIGFSYAIGAIFVDLSDEIKVAQFTRMMEGDHSNVIGIMGDIVYNGYYSMIVPFIFLLVFKNSRWWIKYSLFLFSLFSLFVVGERSCFGISAILCTYYFYKEYKNTQIFYVCIFCLFSICLFFLADFLNSSTIQESRWVGASSGSRERINSAILPYILSHLLIGSPLGFIQLTKFPPHNVIASGFIYGGIIGGICILSMLFYQAKASWFLIKKNKDLLLILAFVAYTLNGLFHNPSIVTGDAMVWILWGSVMYEYKKYKRCINVKRRLPINFSNSACIQC